MELDAIPTVTLFGPRRRKSRTPTLSFTMRGWKTTDLAHDLAG